ncbi:MAG: hypothetical protein ACAH80_12215 [Alphaproteobacteria bacterium]
MFIPSPLLLVTALLLAASIVFYAGIRKTGTEKPGWADRVALLAAMTAACSINFYICIERACLAVGFAALIPAAAIALACLSMMPKNGGRASRNHRRVSLLACLVAGAFSVLVPALT